MNQTNKNNLKTKAMKNKIAAAKKIGANQIEMISPSMNPEIMKLIEGESVKNAIKIMKAYNDENTKTRIAAARKKLFGTNQKTKSQKIDMTTANTYKERIEKLINEWNKINSTNDWNIWSNKIKNEKFGTYGTISIFDVIENTEVKFPSSWIKDSFINECKQALSGIKL